MSESGFVAKYEEMLQDVGLRAGELDGKQIASHWPFVGSDFRGSVVVGQALAGWDAEATTARWLPELASTEDGRQTIIDGTRAWANARPEPMDEVLHWGHRRRSPFWGLSQRLDRLLEPGADGPWYSHHAWWNVYPLGFDRPGASPWGALKEAQAPHVGSLFWEAMEMLGARRVVIVAGKDWWPDVRERLGLESLDQRSLPGKAMVVGQTRAMCAKIYEKVIERHPEWHSDADDKGRVKVIYTGGPADKPEIAKHVRPKEAMKALKLRASNADDELDLFIVCDLWLQGFDSPSVNTMYLVKLMKGHGLFQAVTRPNRPWKDKPAGLVVSYVPVLDALKDAIGLYAKDDQPTIGVDLSLAVKTLLAKHDAVKGILMDHPWNSGAMSATERDAQVTEAASFLARDPDRDIRFRDHVRDLVTLFAICGTRDEAIRIRPDVEFLVAVRATRAKLNGEKSLGQATTRKDLNTAIETLVNGAIEADEVIDVYAVAGAENPEISLLSDAALASITARKHTSMQIEILRKILRDQIRLIERRNAVRGRLLSETLAAAVLRYQNRALTDAEVVLELVEMAKELRTESERHISVGLSEAELAFYDAVIQNDSAVLQLGDETLKTIARELVESIRRSTTLDWRNRESVRAALRVRVKILLKRHGYPPDKEAVATALVLEQAQLFTEEMLAA
jgi:type I restriction enzyme R subunit